MNNLPLQPLVWKDGDICSHIKASARSPLHGYFVSQTSDGDEVSAGYYENGGKTTRYATGFATIDEAKQWAWNHYNEKMQPYVKPMPTWIDASEQLPQVDVDTQFICAYDSVIDTFSKVAWFNADIGKFDYQHDDVLAWMPIPEFITMQNLHKGE